MKINQLKAGAVLSYVSMGIGQIVSLIYTPIMLRLIGQSEYGLYNLVSSVVSYLGLLNFGFGSAYMRYYSRYKTKDDKEGIAKLNGMFLIIFCLIGILAVIAGIILTINSNIIFGTELTNEELTRSKILMIILVLNLAISFPNIIFNSYITANEKFIFQKVLQLVKKITNPFIVLPLLYMGFGSIGMALGTTLLNLGIEVSNIIYCYKKLNIKFSFKEFDLELMKEMTIFSSFIFINMVSSQISWNVDKFILGRFHGTISVAIYGLAAKINGYYLSLGTTISYLFIPRIHRLVGKKNNDEDNELTFIFTKIGRIQFLILGLISLGFIFFGEPFIRFWAGENYKEAYPIILLLILPATLPLIQNIGIEIQRAKNMHSFSTKVYLFIAVINVFISIPLASRYNGLGAALGTALALIAGNGLIMNWYYKSKIGLDIKYFWKEIISIIPSFITPIFLGIILINFFNFNNLYTFIVSGMFFVITYIISVWFLGMNKYEKQLIVEPLNDFFKSNKSNK